MTAWCTYSHHFRHDVLLSLLVVSAVLLVVVDIVVAVVVVVVLLFLLVVVVVVSSQIKSIANIFLNLTLVKNIETSSSVVIAWSLPSAQRTKQTYDGEKIS